MASAMFYGVLIDLPVSEKTHTIFLETCIDLSVLCVCPQLLIRTLFLNILLSPNDFYGFDAASFFFDDVGGKMEGRNEVSTSYLSN